MAFTVEDGSGVADANAYITVAFASDYHTDRGHTSWGDLSTAQQQVAIIKASEYIDKRFGTKFRGWRRSRTQGLEWPRNNAMDDDGYLLSGEDDIPRQIEKATAEYALRAAVYNILAPDPLRPVPDQSFKSGETTGRSTTVVTGEAKRVKTAVGPIEEEVEYATNAELARSIAAGARAIQSSLLDDFIIPQYPEADMWIEELLRTGFGRTLSRGD